MEMQNVDDQLAVNNHEFSATVVKVNGDKVIYKAETSSGAGDGETVNQALTRLDGLDSVANSVAYKIKNAIEGLDVSEFALGNINGSIISIGGLKEVDGKIAKGEGDGITIAPIAEANINALFS